MSGTNANVKSVLIEYFYLDMHTCDRCVGTDKVLFDVVEALKPALTLAGYTVQIKNMEIATEEIAAKTHFLSSPTIRVNGQDICETVEENNCGCCGEISGTAVDCRVFRYGGKTYEVPPQAMLADHILKAVFGTNPASEPKEYVMPDNLKRFFAGKALKVSCSVSKGEADIDEGKHLT